MKQHNATVTCLESQDSKSRAVDFDALVALKNAIAFANKPRRTETESKT